MKIRYVILILSSVLFFWLYTIYKTKQLNQSIDFSNSIETQIDFDLYNQNIFYYKKRCWLNKENRFHYYDAFIEHDDQNLRNYYKLIFLSSKRKNHSFLYIVSSYKNKNYPVGNWFYFNSKGQVLRKEFYKRGKLSKKIVYTYDQYFNKKQVREYLLENQKFILKSQSSYFYNFVNHEKTSRILKKIEHYHQNILLDIVYYHYDNQLRIIKKSSYILNSQLKDFILYHYNQVGLKIKEEKYDRNEKKIFYRDYIYNSKGLLVEQKEYLYKQDKFNPFRHYRYRYNKKGFLTETNLDEVIEGDEGKFRKIYVINYQYNNKGCMLSENRFDAENNLVEKINY